MVPEVLKLPQLGQNDGVAQMDVGRRRVDAQLDAQRSAFGQSCAQAILGVDLHRISGEPVELLSGRHGITRSRMRAIAVARPVSASMSINAPCTSTGPPATSKRTGICVLKR